MITNRNHSTPEPDINSTGGQFWIRGSETGVKEQKSTKGSSWVAKLLKTTMTGEFSKVLYSTNNITKMGTNPDISTVQQYLSCNH